MQTTDMKECVRNLMAEIQKEERERQIMVMQQNIVGKLRKEATDSALVARASLSLAEAGAIRCYLDPTSGHQKNTLLALQALNRHAATNRIRVEDSIALMTEILKEESGRTTGVNQVPAEHQDDYRNEKIYDLATREPMTIQEAEAVLCFLDPTGGYQENTLLAIQVINRHATANKIRVEDSITVLQDYL